MKPLAVCLDLARAYASLVRRLDGRLGGLHGLSFGDFAMLLRLSEAPGGRLRRVDLAAQLGLTPSAVTRSLIPLEKIGLVKRERDARDARVGYASLTKAGERVLREATESAEEVSGEVLDLGADQLKLFSAVLSRLA